VNILTTTKDTYKQWAEEKLESFTPKIDDLMVEITNPLNLTKSEKSRIKTLIKNYNMAFYNISRKFRDTGKSLLSLSQEIGLGDYELDSKSYENGLTPIKASSKEKIEDEYIPYTNKSLNWHTDGYYNDNNKPIFSWLLHCENPSDEGGENKYMDHEIAYILFNQKYENLCTLMKDTTYTIPENKKNKRSDVTGYVFSFNNKYNKLHMKFTMRTNNIFWDSESLSAINNLKSLINNSVDYHLRHKLIEGQGVITNNVIHMRSSFTISKNKNRLLYRLRSKKRICI